MIFSTIANAIGLSDPPAPTSHTDRHALVKSAQAKIAIEITDFARESAQRVGEFNSSKQAESDKLAADAKALDLKLSKDTASEFAAIVVPFLRTIQDEGMSRKQSLLLKDALQTFKARVRFEQDQDLDHHMFMALWASLFIEKDESLYSVFSDATIFAHAPTESVFKLFSEAEALYPSSFEKNLSDLQSLLEGIARHAPRSVPTAQHKAAYNAICTYSTASHRVAFTQALHHVAPVVAPTVAPVYAPVVDTKPIQVQVDFNESAQHFAKLPQVDFAKI